MLRNVSQLEKIIFVYVKPTACLLIRQRASDVIFFLAIITNYPANLCSTVFDQATQYKITLLSSEYIGIYVNYY